MGAGIKYLNDTIKKYEDIIKGLEERKKTMPELVHPVLDKSIKFHQSEIERLNKCIEVEKETVDQIILRAMLAHANVKFEGGLPWS